MDSAEKLILTLVKSAMTGEKYKTAQKPDYRYILYVGRNHGITNILYRGLENCDLLCSSNETDKLFDEVCANILVSKQQIFISHKLENEFRKANIDYMPLKGLNLKKLYPESNMRSMGDMDILVKPEQYEKIRKIMLGLGFTEGEESDHEYIWSRQNVYIELHKRLIPTNNEDYVEYFGDGWEFAVKCDDEPNKYQMKTEDEFIFIFTHLAKHYRDTGIGIKHFVDLWVFENHYDFDRQYVEEKLKSLDLFEFYNNIKATLNVWFGEEEENEKTDYITDYIFKCGNFGTEENHIYSQALIASLKTGSVFSGKLYTFTRLVFPTFAHMAQKYPVLKKAPVLLPVAYVIRWFETVFKKKGTVTKYKNELNSQTEENIENYRKNLEYVGLKYKLKKQKNNQKQT